MKKLKKAELKQLVGGLRPPANGVCYQAGENCNLTSQCCPGQNLICIAAPSRTCRYFEDVS